MLVCPALTLWAQQSWQELRKVFHCLRRTGFRAYGVAAIDYDNDGWVDIVGRWRDERRQRRSAPFFPQSSAPERFQKDVHR